MTLVLISERPQAFRVSKAARESKKGVDAALGGSQSEGYE